MILIVTFRSIGLQTPTITQILNNYSHIWACQIGTEPFYHRPRTMKHAFLLADPGRSLLSPLRAKYGYLAPSTHDFSKKGPLLRDVLHGVLNSLPLVVKSPSPGECDFQKKGIVITNFVPSTCKQYDSSRRESPARLKGVFRYGFRKYHLKFGVKIALSEKSQSTMKRPFSGIKRGIKSPICDTLKTGIICVIIQPAINTNTYLIWFT